MLLFVVLTLFTDWIWVDATDNISMGFELPVYTFYSEEIVFTDLDGDEDQDMVRFDENHTPLLQAFENTEDEDGNPLWKENPHLIQSIESSETINSLSAGDINGDGKEEIVVLDGATLIGYVNIDTAWEPDPSLFDDIETDHTPWYSDFTDVDNDGDLDMLGGWGTDPMGLTLAIWWNVGTTGNPSWEFDSSYFDVEVFTGVEHPAWINWNSDGVWDVLFTTYILADPPPYGSEIQILVNNGTGEEPIWDLEWIDEWIQLDELALFDWNQDETEDILMFSEWDEGYLYLPGERFADSISYDFFHPRVWGGILADNAAAADLDSDGIPELAAIQHIFHMDIWGPGYILPHIRFYSSVNETGTQWRQQDRRYPWYSDGTRAHLQYLDYNGDGLTDYVTTRVTYHEDDTIGILAVYKNQGSATQPQWPQDGELIEGLPDLLPSCFLDVDGDGDLDLIGELIVDYEDSTVVGYVNTGSDQSPVYEFREDFTTGLPSAGITFLSPGDITDNGIDLSDLAAGIGGENLTAFFNTGQENPRWQRHDEVFSSLGVAGNPCLCDADGDDDQDLYLVTDGHLHYYRNESTGGIAETRSDLKPVAITYVGNEVELRFSAPGSDNVHLMLYDSAGRMVRQLTRKSTGGEILFSVNQRPGIYFYKIQTEQKDYSGKIVIF